MSDESKKEEQLSQNQQNQNDSETKNLETSAVDTALTASANSSNDQPPASSQTEGSDMLKIYDETLRDFEEGEIVRGTVVKIDRDAIMVDIGYKSEGYVPLFEFGILPDGTPNVKEGDVIDVYLMRKEDSEGLVVLSKEIADQKLVWDQISKSYETGHAVQGAVNKRIKGGLRVDIGNMRAFLPASQVELHPVQNLDKYIGKTYDFRVIKLSKRRRNIVLSRRVILEEELEKKKKSLLDSVEIGQVRGGIVKNITPFGAFVDLGGIDGLLHKSDMSWGRVNDPSEQVAIGNKIQVMVLSIDKGNERISLGIKQITPDPWLNIEEKYPVGSTVTGKVVNIVDYGAFVELEPGVEGLIHASEMSWTRRVVHPSKILNKGGIIQSRILEINKEKQKISLGLKQLQPNPWEELEAKYPIGSKIKGIVRNITDFGAFVEIEAGIDGLIHVSDLSWSKRVVSPSEILKEGDQVEVVVLSIDPEAQRVSLGLKQIEPDPWIQVPEKYKIGSIAKCHIVNLTSFGAFAKLEEGVEGLIHISELDEKHVSKPEEVVNVGDEVYVKVINLDPVERRIGLSLRAYKTDQERSHVEEYMQEQSRGAKGSLGDFIQQQSAKEKQEKEN